MLTQSTKRIRTAGRLQGAGRSLSMRRVWYADPVQAADGEKKDDAGDASKSDDSKAGEDGEDDDSALEKLKPGELAYLVRKARREAGDFRTQLRQKEQTASAAQQVIDKAEKDRKDAEAKTLQEQGNFKKLYEDLQPEITQLREKAKRADAFEEKLKARNEVRVKAIPDSHKKLIPNGYSPDQLEEWLDANEKLLVTPAAPNLNSGKKGIKTQEPPAMKRIKF